MCKGLLYCGLLLLCLPAVAQTGGNDALTGFGMESNMLAGKVIKHSPKFTAPIPSLSEALDMNFIWQTYGKKPWHQRRNFPLIGVGVTYTNYGNNAVFGQCVGIYPNLQIPLLRRGNWEWTFRLGDGLGYVTRKYQTTAPVDTINTAIGTHIDDFAIFMMDLRYHINEHWLVQCGANFTHISNADFHEPNLGVNMAGAHIGLQYYPTGCHPKRLIKELPKLSNRWLAEARLGIAWNEARAKGNPELPTYLASVYVSRRWLSKNKFFGGTDYSFSESTHAFLKNYGVELGHQDAHSWDGAFFVGNEFLLGRLGLVAQVGVYYQQTYLRQDPAYEKLGGNFYIIKQEHGVVKELFVSAMLKTHLIIAEFAEFGVGAGF